MTYKIIRLAVALLLLSGSAYSTNQTGANLLSSMPLAFTKNLGQWPDSILFRAGVDGATMWFTQYGAYYHFTRHIPKTAPSTQTISDSSFFANPDGRYSRVPDDIETSMIKATFVGANPAPLIEGQGLMEYKCNYFLGNNSSKWRTDVLNYESIVFKDIYAGIDLKYYGNGRQMEYDFIISPGADYAQINIQYEGVRSLAINGSGELVVEMEWGEVTELRPNIFQLENGEKRAVSGVYHLISENSFGFRLDDNYDPCLAVIIDPVLVFSTYLGGGGEEYAQGIVADDSGYIYIAGYTSSSDFPTLNPYQTYQSMYDVFITKLNIAGDGLLYSTYLGCSNHDFGHGIAVDSSGCTYITGYTGGTNFPTQNPYQTNQGSPEAFVTKLNNTGNGLIYSTFLGGSNEDYGQGIAVDGFGAAFITGFTNSTDFPTANPYLASFQGGNYDAFVTKLSGAGNTLVYSTFLGGDAEDRSWAIAIDNAGDAYITGRTRSTNYPTANAFDSSHNNNWDAFVTCLGYQGNSLVYSTYLGGASADSGKSIAVDNAGNAYVTGSTESNDFPTANPYQTYQGGEDAFVSKFNDIGNVLTFSTYLGGSDNDECGNSITIDDDGNAYIIGLTHSDNFPLVNAYYAGYNGIRDGFVSVLNKAGNDMVFSTYLGGTDNDDICYSVSLDTDDNILVVGESQSSDFPTSNPYDDALNGSSDAFIAKIEAPIPQIQGLVPNQNALNITPSTNISVTFSIPMDAATINDTTFLAYGNYTGYHSGSISYDAPTLTATLNPDNDFQAGEQVAVNLSNLIESAEGVPPGKGYSWSFMTAADITTAAFDSLVAYGAGAIPYSIHCGDVDADGDADVIVSNREDDNIEVYMNDGSGTLSPGVTYAGGDHPYHVALADFDGDGDMDVVTVNSYIDRVSILINGGAGVFDSPVSYLVGDAPIFVDCADLNMDGHVDLAVANEISNDVSVLLGIGDGSFQPKIDYPVSNHPSSVCAADLDGDGDPDLAVTSVDFSRVSVLRNNGDGTYQTKLDYNTGTAPYIVAAVDIDDDSDLDLASLNNGSLDISILKNNGDATFQTKADYAVGGHPLDFCAGDFDGDNDLDFAVTNAENTVTVIRNDGNGTLASPVSFPVSGTRGIYAADLDKDLDLDLAVANNLQSSISVLINMTATEIVTCGDAGSGSLRNAITWCNNNSGIDSILFSVSGTIALNTSLPALIDDSTVILGSTAPGGVHSVILDGSGLAGGSGFVIQSRHNKIEGLTIRNFPANGIEVVGPLTAYNVITNNIVYGNGEIGIDLGNDGVTPNDPGDTDTGPNDLLNYPAIDSVYMNPDSSFTVWGKAEDSAIVELFVAHPANDGSKSEDPSGHGEAHSFIGRDTCDVAGDFAFVIPKTFPQFSLITMTATDTIGNTSEFSQNFSLTPAPLIIVAYSPVNLKVTDPNGFYIGKDSLGVLSQTLFPATYDEPDHDSIHIPHPILGTYIIEVIKEHDASTDAKYSIGIRIDGSTQCIQIANATVPSSGTTAIYNYDVEEGYHYINGDPNDNTLVNIQDITFLINFLYKGGASPSPIWAGDANCNGLVNIQDITYLINFLYKSGPPPCKLN